MSTYGSKYYASKYYGSRYYRPLGDVVEVYEPDGGPSDFALLLQDDEEVIMLVARAFLTLVNRCP